ncbi:MAG: hypothetical protein AB1454_04120 [Candidatus Auribacterota bacterium]
MDVIEKTQHDVEPMLLTEDIAYRMSLSKQYTSQCLKKWRLKGWIKGVRINKEYRYRVSEYNRLIKILETRDKECARRILGH